MKICVLLMVVSRLIIEAQGKSHFRRIAKQLDVFFETRYDNQQYSGKL